MSVQSNQIAGLSLPGLVVALTLATGCAPEESARRVRSGPAHCPETADPLGLRRTRYHLRRTPSNPVRRRGSSRISGKTSFAGHQAG